MKTLFGCGHMRTDAIIMSNAIMGLISYKEWKETTGSKSKNLECFDCYLERVST